MSVSDPVTLVSVGMSCQIAHQLSRFAQLNPGLARFQSGPFDWLICPPLSAAAWMRDGMPPFDRADIVVERNYPYWPKYDFWFWHGFQTKSEQNRVLDIPTNAQRELDKLTYQRDRFLSLNPSETLFFVGNSQNNLSDEVFTDHENDQYIFDEDKYKLLEHALCGLMNTEVVLQATIRQDRATKSFAIHKNAHVLPPDMSEWKGNDADWDQLIKKVIETRRVR